MFAHVSIAVASSFSVVRRNALHRDPPHRDVDHTAPSGKSSNLSTVLPVPSAKSSTPSSLSFGGNRSFDNLLRGEQSDLVEAPLGSTGNGSILWRSSKNRRVRVSDSGWTYNSWLVVLHSVSLKIQTYLNFNCVRLPLKLSFFLCNWVNKQKKRPQLLEAIYNAHFVNLNGHWGASFSPVNVWGQKLPHNQ